MAANLIEFSRVVVEENNKIRFRDTSKFGKKITKKDEKRVKQKLLFLERKEKEMKNELVMLRKYRKGDLPDIEIKFQAIIDPLAALCQEDSEICGQFFITLFTSLHQMELQDSLKENAENQLSEMLLKSTKFNYQFISTLQQTMLHLTKKGQIVFKHDIITTPGLKSFSYHTAALLLEESLISLEETQGGIQGPIQKRPKLEMFPNDFESEQKIWNSNFWYYMDLIDMYTQLKEYDQVEGILSFLFGSFLKEKRVKETLDLKMSNKFNEAFDGLSALMEEKQIFQKANEEMQNRLLNHLQNEQQDCLMSLGK